MTTTLGAIRNTIGANCQRLCHTRSTLHTFTLGSNSQPMLTPPKVHHDFTAVINAQLTYFLSHHVASCRCGAHSILRRPTTFLLHILGGRALPAHLQTQSGCSKKAQYPHLVCAPANTIRQPSDKGSIQSDSYIQERHT